MQVSGSVAIVTGGASGLGEATVRRLVVQGARVVIADVSVERGTALAAELGDRAVFVRTDVTSSSDIAAAIEVAEGMGGLDALVCCAGIAAAKRTVDREGNPADLEGFTRVVNVNLIGTFDAVRQAAAAMARTTPNADGERGVIIMTASVAAFDGQVGQVAYSATKGGIVGMTLPLARDLAPSAIRVMTIAPGLLDTPIYEFAPPELKEQLSQNAVFPKRLGRPDEYAHLVTAIVENTLLNGETIRLDGAVRLPPK
jgi:3-hydroxyacyl-CoA dehydrogenase/3-hydroxy-2-methylbutyryl-CoA dehydrogenase